MEEFHRVRKAYPRAVVASGFTGSAMNCAGSVIDVSSVREMLEVRHTPACISIGASCNFETVKKELGGVFPYMNPYLDAFGSLQVRNQASVGTLPKDHRGDTMPLCLVHDAVCIVSGRAGAASKQPVLLRLQETALKPSEILMAVDSRCLTENPYFARKRSDAKYGHQLGILCGCGNAEEKCAAIRLARRYGGHSTRALQTERFLKGKVFSRATAVRQAFLEKDFTPLSDIRAVPLIVWMWQKNVGLSL